MLTQLSSMVDNGLSFHSIEDIVCNQYEQYYWRLRLRYEQDSSTLKLSENVIQRQSFPPFDQKAFPFPHEKIIRSVFVSYSLLFDQLFYDDMACRTSRWLACDHTFKSAGNIGFTRESDGRWIKLMKCVFIVLDNNGKIIHWRFTKGESFNEVSGIFRELKDRFERLNTDLEGIVIDNCCKWRSQFQSQFFPNILVKLDLFHAVQRFVTTLPMAIRLNTDICKGYGLIFRQSNDLGIKRLQPTPDKETLIANLESFQRWWKSKTWKGEYILNQAAKKAICNIKLHIVKGCLSGIPVNVSTSRNERLHRNMNNVLKINKIGLETAYVRCSRLFFKINNQGNNSIKKLMACSKDPPDFSKRVENFGFETFRQIGGELEAIIPEKNVMIYKSLDELSEEVICNIRNAISSSLQTSDDIQDEHTYAKNKGRDNNMAMAIADSAIIFYELYKGLEHIGGTRLLLKTNLAHLIGLEYGNTFNALRNMRSHFATAATTDGTKAVLTGHLQFFGLEEVEVPGDGNCFFTAVAFHLSTVLNKGAYKVIADHLRDIGLLPTMSVQELSTRLRNLIVQEWRGDFASDYASFLPDNVDYLSEVEHYERPGFFGGNLGDLMPMAMANVLGIPLGIITSEPSTPIINVCPRGFVMTATPIFLAYTSSGPGHYNAVSPIVPLHPSGTVDTTESRNVVDCKENFKSSTPGRKGCRCGQTTQAQKNRKAKPLKKYKSYKRCNCMIKFKSCCDRCKCVGKCGGCTCKTRVVKVRRKTKSSPRVKHILQTQKNILPSGSTPEENTTNFLEVCVLCSIINFFRSGYFTLWDAETVYSLYIGVIEGLFNLNIVLPLRKWQKEFIWKKVLKLKKDFEI
ncbi:uncharacterized protein LOC114532711 [Dendronephthya gigantea]|nr:uncharacterized protein LOC114532711 [Dendronephthya gigantea]